MKGECAPHVHGEHDLVPVTEVPASHCKNGVLKTRGKTTYF